MGTVCLPKDAVRLILHHSRQNPSVNAVCRLWRRLWKQIVVFGSSKQPEYRESWAHDRWGRFVQQLMLQQPNRPIRDFFEEREEMYRYVRWLVKYEEAPSSVLRRAICEGVIPKDEPNIREGLNNSLFREPNWSSLSVLLDTQILDLKRLAREFTWMWNTAKHCTEADLKIATAVVQMLPHWDPLEGDVEFYFNAWHFACESGDVESVRFLAEIPARAARPWGNFEFFFALRVASSEKRWGVLRYVLSRPWMYVLPADEADFDDVYEFDEEDDPPVVYKLWLSMVKAEAPEDVLKLLLEWAKCLPGSWTPKRFEAERLRRHQNMKCRWQKEVAQTTNRWRPDSTSDTGFTIRENVPRDEPMLENEITILPFEWLSDDDD